MGIRYWEERAAAGSIVAQSVLGCALVRGGEFDGETIAPDHARALQYLQGAANAGASRAIYHLGVMYEDGLGVREDLPRALALHEKAADGGEYFAILHAARLYADGRLGYKDSERARVWYERLPELAVDLEPDRPAATVNGDAVADTDAEVAKARLFLATGALPASAKRARGAP